MNLFFRLLKESINFAYQAIIVNKLRTFLTLLGITIGIFAIISVLTVIDSMERNIRSSISSLGENVIYVQKWPWAFGADYPWWDYYKRPVPKYYEYEAIKKRSLLAEASAFSIGTEKSIQYLDNSIDQVFVVASSHEIEKIRNIEISRGRYFSFFEAQNGRPVAIIGAQIAEDLFGNGNPLGKEIKLMGHKMRIVGILKEEGKSILGGTSLDQIMFIPINYGRKVFDVRNERLNPDIMVMAKPGVNIEAMKSELTSIMRAVRRLRPQQDNNFALNQASLLSQGFKQIFIVIDLAGWIIGGFSILVGGFGIANIMFVSVKERTNIIGIQKSLGAKDYFILLEFLFEGILLALIGGILGLILVYSGAQFIQHAFDMEIYLTLGNTLLGLIVSIIIGVVSGFAPAYSAARLNPVIAISTRI